MEVIQQAFVNVWWWLQGADEQTIAALVALVASSTVVSWVIQHWKRRFNIDLKKNGKAVVLAVLTVLSSIMSVADWYLLQNPADFQHFFFGYGAAIYAVATMLHRFHVSPLYERFTTMLRRVAAGTEAARQAKYGSVLTPPSVSADAVTMHYLDKKSQFER